MDFDKVIEKINLKTKIPEVELITKGEGLIPKAMEPTTSTLLGSGVYEIVETTRDSDNNATTILRKTNKVFPVPEKVYGDTPKWVHLVLSSYVELGKSSLLSYGKKGNGKTLLIDMIAKLANKKFKLPIIVVGRISNGQSLVSLLRQIGPCVLYMDEFTKLVQFSAQEDLLSYLSSSDSKGTIVLMTTNKVSNLSEYIKDRPDRIRYQVYRGNVDEDTIDEYCEEHLKYKQFIPDIKKASLDSNAFNMDSLMAVVVELNMRFNPKVKVPLTFKEMISALNVALKSGPGYIVDKVTFKDTGIEYANVELIPQNYGRFEFKMILTMNTGIVPAGGHFGRMDHKGFENGCHIYKTEMRVKGVGPIDATLYIKELVPNMGNSSQAI